ncbi:hypothetical protein A3726_10515 [Erythrobacter sp. HI0037]|nr:hypothetical protein A3719_15310 [Erythrobacter sp. HI0020]KZY13719.1 hypothetical protein A3727_01260 [Erythrobacter sp. HI0038]KZY17068.1 hypothetical protein A3726_10515 [Erythrobacter sp. HI0037]
MMSTDFAFKLRFKGEGLQAGGLRLYDGTTSLHGFARALQITMYAYLNDDLVGRATALRGASLFIKPPRSGSVLFDILARFTRTPKSAPLNADTLYDFTEVALKRATGHLDAEAKSPFVRKKLAEDEPFFDELAEKLEGSLQEAHRVIDEDHLHVSLERPRSPLLHFDLESSQWVHTREEDPMTREYRGNMTRFNTQTGNGRAYFHSIKKIVPVRKSDAFNQVNKGFLTWSLHGSHLSTDKDLIFTGRKIESAQGETKRFIIDDCRQA